MSMYEFGEKQQTIIAGWTVSKCIEMLETASVVMKDELNAEERGFYSQIIAAIAAQIKKLS